MTVLNKILSTVLVFSAFLAISCDDTTDIIGSGMAGNLDNFKVSTDTFTLTTRTMKADSVLARCANARIGCIRDPETGALIKSSYVTQFYILEGRSFPALDTMRSFTPAAKEELLQKKEDGSFDMSKPLLRKVSLYDIVADSIQLIVYPINITGDSLQPMRLTVHELEKPMVEDRYYYSNFDPIKEGFVNENKWIKKQTFTLADQTSDSTETHSSNYSTYFRIPLNEKYDDGKGNVLNNGEPFNNYGTYILRTYYDGIQKGMNHFRDFNAFINEVCPGMYLKMDNGAGAIATIRGTGMNLYFKVWGNDTVPAISSYSTFFGTEEILQATNYETNREVVNEMLKDQTCSYMKTPAGLYTEATIPVKEIKLGHEKDSLSSVKVAFKCMNHDITGNTHFKQSSYMLMIPADSVITFFEKQKLTDGKTAFLSSYSSSSNSYVFNNIAGIVAYMSNLYNTGVATDPKWEEKHPNWNKVALLPVEATSTTTGNVSAIYNNLGLTSTKLVGGAQQVEPIKVAVVYNRLSD